MCPFDPFRPYLHFWLVWHTSGHRVGPGWGGMLTFTNACHLQIQAGWRLLMRFDTLTCLTCWRKDQPSPFSGHLRTLPSLLTQLPLSKLHRRWGKLAQLHTGWVHDVSVHGREELATCLSQVKPPISHIRPYRRTGVGSYVRTKGRVKCEARTVNREEMRRTKHLKAKPIAKPTAWARLADSFFLLQYTKTTA